MIIEGTHLIAGVPPDRVFDALADPAILARSVPGCQRLVDKGDGVYDLTLEAGAGPVRGSYTGHVRLGERRAPELYEASLDASGAPGSVHASLRAALEGADSGTTIQYFMDANLAGPIAGVGQRVLSGVSRKNATMFFRALEEQLTTVPPPVAAGPQAAVPATRAAPAAQVYSGSRTKPSADRQRWLRLGLLAGSALTVLVFRLARVVANHRRKGR